MILSANNGVNEKLSCHEGTWLRSNVLSFANNKQMTLCVAQRDFHATAKDGFSNTV